MELARSLSPVSAPTPTNPDLWQNELFMVDPENKDYFDEQILKLIRVNRVIIYSLLNGFTINLLTPNMGDWELKLFDWEDSTKCKVIADKIDTALHANKVVMAVLAWEDQNKDSFTITYTVGECNSVDLTPAGLYRDLLYLDVQSRNFHYTNNLGDFKILWNRISSSD